MVRDVALLGAAIMAFQVACPHAQSAPAAEANGRHVHHPAVTSAHNANVHKTPVRRQVARASTEPSTVETALQFPAPEVNTSDGAPTPLSFHAVTATAAAEPAPASDVSRDPAKKPHHDAPVVEAAFEVPPMPTTPPVLSDQESQAGQLAGMRGDKTFVMVDKTLGKIILFENGQPVFAGPALTGASTADSMPKAELGARFDTLNAQDTKITPAGRYTVERGFDPEVGGPLFDIHEIRGKDWGIAIHTLYLGIPAEHRDVRILSPIDEDKHITFGCINVQTTTLHLLMHELPAKGPIPLYILPEDASKTAEYLMPHTSS